MQHTDHDQPHRTNHSRRIDAWKPNSKHGEFLVRLRPWLITNRMASGIQGLFCTNPDGGNILCSRPEARSLYESTATLHVHR